MQMQGEAPLARRVLPVHLARLARLVVPRRPAQAAVQVRLPARLLGPYLQGLQANLVRQGPQPLLVAALPPLVPLVHRRQLQKVPQQAPAPRQVTLLVALAAVLRSTYRSSAQAKGPLGTYLHRSCPTSPRRSLAHCRLSHFRWQRELTATRRQCALAAALQAPALRRSL